jgi:hypothetical protein
MRFCGNSKLSLSGVILHLGRSEFPKYIIVPYESRLDKYQFRLSL